MKRSLWMWVAAAGCVGGCNVGPDYKRPEVSVPAGYTEAEGAKPTTRPATQPALPVNLETWWHSFNDPVLDSLVDRAVRGNLDLRIATSRIREARAQRGVVSAGEWPQVNAGGTAQKSKSSPNLIPGGAGAATGGTGGTGSTPSAAVGSFGSSESNFFQVGFDASWEIDVFGGTRREIEAAEADIQASQENRRDVLVSLLAEVARNYVDLRSFQRQLAITQANLKSQQQSVELAESRFRAGLTSELDVAQARAQVSSTESQIPALEASIRRSIHRIGVLTGQAPGALTSELLKEAPIPPAIPEVPIGLPSDLLRRRADIRRAERQLAAATARIGSATADLFPRFSLTGSLGLESREFKNLGSANSNYWSIGPSFSWPIFDAGRIRSNIQVQNARQEQALSQYEQSVLIALEDVENALVAYGKERVRWRSLSDAVQANRRAFDLANEQYSHGLVNFLNVLEAERSLFVAEQQLVQSEQLVSSDLVALYKALGGGWESMEPAPPPPPQQNRP